MSLWNGFLGFLLLVLCANGASTRAQNNSAPEVPESALAQQILVLQSGRVVKGNIQPRGDGYDINLTNGQLFVGSEQVWLLADNLPEAHQTMRDSYPVLTPDIHMQLASWCVENQLWGTARRELLDALHKDPYREQARRMLARVTRLQDSANVLPSVAGSAPTTDATAARMMRPRRSLGGLSSELARDFTRQIQPLLSNKCSSCHDIGSGRTFVIESTRKGSNPAIAKRNLNAILDQLDPAKTEPGQFLNTAMAQHGSMKSLPFPRQVGTILGGRLSSWVERVQREKGFSTVQRSPIRQLTTVDADVVSYQAVHQSRERRDSSVRSAEFVVRDSNPHELIRATNETESEILADAHRRNRNDRFDPEIFNQRYRVRTKLPDADSGRANRRSP